jgi:hypothetical protein
MPAPKRLILTPAATGVYLAGKKSPAQTRARAGQIRLGPKSVTLRLRALHHYVRPGMRSLLGAKSE